MASVFVIRFCIFQTAVQINPASSDVDPLTLSDKVYD